VRATRGFQRVRCVEHHAEIGLRRPRVRDLRPRPYHGDELTLLLAGRCNPPLEFRHAVGELGRPALFGIQVARNLIRGSLCIPESLTRRVEIALRFCRDRAGTHHHEHRHERHEQYDSVAKHADSPEAPTHSEQASTILHVCLWLGSPKAVFENVHVTDG
jgi:hypothetical protein